MFVVDLLRSRHCPALSFADSHRFYIWLSCLLAPLFFLPSSGGEGSHLPPCSGEDVKSAGGCKRPGWAPRRERATTAGCQRRRYTALKATWYPSVPVTNIFSVTKFTLKAAKWVKNASLYLSRSMLLEMQKFKQCLSCFYRCCNRWSIKICQESQKR